MIIPGILEKNFDEVRKKVKLIEQVAPIIQLDMADGKLVDGLTFQDISKVGELETSSEIELDLMEIHPLEFLQKRISNVSRIIFHLGSKDDLLEDILKAKSFDYLVGFGISPAMQMELLEPYAEYLDYVQFMTIKPGGQGRQFVTEVLDEIAVFKSSFPKIRIQVDGGISENTLLLAKEAGANDVVVGSHIFNTPNPLSTYQKFEELERKK